MSLINDANFSEHSEKIAKLAAETILRYQHAVIDSDHLLLALLEAPDQDLEALFNQLELDVSQLRKRIDRHLRRRSQSPTPIKSLENLQISPRLKKIVDEAVLISRRLWASETNAVHLFLAVVESYFSAENELKTYCGRLLHQTGVTPIKTRKILIEMR